MGMYLEDHSFLVLFASQLPRGTDLIPHLPTTMCCLNTRPKQQDQLTTGHEPKVEFLGLFSYSNRKRPHPSAHNALLYVTIERKKTEFE